MEAGCDLIGVNNRDLRTFKVDIETAVRLAEFMPQRRNAGGRKWHSQWSGHCPIYDRLRVSRLPDWRVA